MGYTTFKNNEQPALSDTILNLMQVELMKLVFPIGSTYITQDTTNPADILKFGTWERLKGKVCLGLDEDDTDLSTIGKTGGEKKHTLTVNEMPSHTHSNGNIYALTPDKGSAPAVGVLGGTGEVSQYLGDDGKTGGGQAHNNMQPYEVVGYMWIRRS